MTPTYRPRLTALWYGALAWVPVVGVYLLVLLLAGCGDFRIVQCANSCEREGGRMEFFDGPSGVCRCVLVGVRP